MVSSPGHVPLSAPVIPSSFSFFCPASLLSSPHRRLAPAETTDPGQTNRTILSKNFLWGETASSEGRGVEGQGPDSSGGSSGVLRRRARGRRALQGVSEIVWFFHSSIMGAKKGGPCGHCGSTESPVWRKGPDTKPVLCNACGARWITKRTLDGYLPKSAGGTARKPKPRAKSATVSSSRNSQRRVSASSRRGRPAAVGGDEPLILSGKRAKRAPQKYQDTTKPKPAKAKRGSAGATTSSGPVSSRSSKRKSLKVEVGGKPGKVQDRIPSPQKPAKKRRTVRILYVEDLEGPKTTVPPKKKKYSLLDRYPYRKHSVLKSSESPLCHVDLLSIVRETNFKACLSEEDKESLAAMLPPVDVGEGSADLSGVFSSEAFRSAVLNYQDLLKSGSFDPDLPAANLRMVDHYDRLTRELNLTKWIAEVPTNTSRRSRGSAASSAGMPSTVQAMQEALMKSGSTPKIEFPATTEAVTATS